MSQTLFNFMENYRVETSDSVSEHNVLSYGKFWGKFNIPMDKYDEFLELYANEIENGAKLSIIEKPKDINPIVVDFDIKIDSNDTETRLYTKKQIKKVIKTYVDVLEKNQVDLDDITIYSLEKQTPTQKNNQIKDGFHLHICGLKFTKDFRLKIYNEVNEKLNKKNIFNTDVFKINDKAVVSSNGWFLYNGRKPDSNNFYEITMVYNGESEEFMKIDKSNNLIDIIKFLSLNNNNDSLFTYDEEIDEEKEIQIINNQIETLDNSNEVKDLLIDILSESRADDHDDWIKVLLLSKTIGVSYEAFDNFSKKCSKKYNKYENKKIWDNTKIKNNGPVYSVATLHYWAKMDNPVEYTRIMKLVKPLPEKQIKQLNKQKQKEEQQLNKQKQKEEQQLNKQKQKEEEQEESESEYKKWYNETKVRIEKEWFKIKHPMTYCRLYKGQIKSVKKNDCEEILKTENFKLNNNKRRFFFNEWSADSSIAEYETAVFDPLNTDPKVYNLYTGFENDVNAEPVCNEAIAKVVNACFKTEEGIRYFYSWVSQILNNPSEKCGTAIIMYSKAHGVGKGSIVDLIRSLIDDKYVAKLDSIDDIKAKFNANYANKFFIYGDEIKSRASDLSQELKNIITQPQLNVELKGIDKYTIKDCGNYMFSTNCEVAFNIEKSDRRFFAVEIDDENAKLTRTDFIEFRKAIQDKKIIQEMFSFIKNYKNPFIIVGNTPPMTDYKARLTSFSLDAITSFFFKRIDLYKNSVYGANELYNMIIEHAKANKIVQNITIKYFGDAMAKIIKSSDGLIVKARINTGVIYKFPGKKDMLKVLKKYDNLIYIALGIDNLEPGTDVISNVDVNNKTKYYDV